MGWGYPVILTTKLIWEAVIWRECLKNSQLKLVKAFLYSKGKKSLIKLLIAIA